MKTSNNITTIDYGQGQSLSVIGDTYLILISGGHTNRAYTVIDMLVPAGGGPGPHAHKDTQEMFYVVEGAIDFKMEGRSYTAKKGSFVNIPWVALFTHLNIQQTRLRICYVQQGFMASNIGGEVTSVWVSPPDIAMAIAEEITTEMKGRLVRYVASEEITYNKLARIIGEAIGKPGLKWLTLTDEQMENNAVAAGIQPKIAAGLTEMYASINSGLLYEDYKLHRPATMGKIKVEDFAKEFAAVYNQQ